MEVYVLVSGTILTYVLCLYRFDVYICYLYTCIIRSNIRVLEQYAGKRNHSFQKCIYWYLVPYIHTYVIPIQVRYIHMLFVYKKLYVRYKNITIVCGEKYHSFTSASGTIHIYIPFMYTGIHVGYICLCIHVLNVRYTNIIIV